MQMPQRELQKIQGVVQEVAEAIASALMIEVEIIDNNLVVVGATGRVRGHIGIKQETAHVARHILEVGTNYAIDEPGKHVLCDLCQLNNKCYYTAALICPINLKGRVLGTISLVSFDEKQRQQLLSRQGQYLDFISRMGELIAGQLQLFDALNKIEKSERQLKTIIDSVNEGIIAVDSSANITHFNKAAVRLLRYQGDLLTGRPIKNIFSDSPLLEVIKSGTVVTDKEVAYSNNNHQTKFLSSAFPVVADNQIVGAVESFKEMAQISQIANRLISGQEQITFEDIKGNSFTLRKLIDRASVVASGNSTVLLQGESGTGKELFARAIHHASSFHNGPFQTINCSAIPDSLLESELFGYEEGAFTGARKGGKPGKFELANNGTLFLDEIGDMPLQLQAKLLRVLEHKKLERVGGTKEITFKVRLISATNRNLEDMLKEGQFREDLFYRLNVIPLHIPSLRERREDIVFLAEHFLEKYSFLLNKHIADITTETKDILQTYHWPGNVRELENIIEYAVNFENTAKLSKSSLPQAVLQKSSDPKNSSELKEKVSEQEYQIIQNLLEEMGSSLEAKKAIAARLGVSLTTLYRKLNNK